MPLKENYLLDANNITTNTDDDINKQRACLHCKRSAQNDCPHCLDLKEMTTALEEFIGRVNEQLLKSEMSNMELEQIFSACVDPMLVVGTDGFIVRANRQMLALLDKNHEEVVGADCSKFLTEKECELATTNRKTTQTDIDLINSNGEQVSYIMTTSRLVTLDGTPGTLAQYKDITERKQAARALAEAHAAVERIAKIDGLTQIPNRRTFDETLLSQWQQLSTTKQPLAIILCDIDFFKRYNDHYGHQQGDECLIAVAQELNNSRPDTTGLTARYGGEEFIFLLPNTTLESACVVAESARARVEHLKINHADSDIADHVTLSFGVSSCIPCGTARMADLIKAADEALYQSKEDGRNRITAAGHTD